LLQAQEHFSVIAAGTDRPFQLNGQLFRARRRRRFGFKRGLRDRELRPRLLETLAGAVAILVRLLRLGGGRGPVGYALTPRGGAGGVGGQGGIRAAPVAGGPRGDGAG